MRTSKAGLEFIKEHEGCVLTAYKDPVGIWTIGVGHTGPDVFEGLVITEEEALSLLSEDVEEAEKCISAWVDVDLSQNQYDALCSFIFNCGCGAFKTSTLLRLLNGGNYVAAAQQFGRWNKAGGRVLPGLTRRRSAEAELFNT